MPRNRRTTLRNAARVVGCIAIVAIGVEPAFAHRVEASGPVAWQLHWTFEPWVIACLAASLAMYTSGLVRLWRRAGVGHGIHRRQALAFAAGWLALVVALVSPLDALGVQLFSAHMLQHELLMLVAAPLLVVARPLAAWTWALPTPMRRFVGAGLRRPGWRRIWRRIRSPVAAWLLQATAIWIWHAPALFDAALVDDTVHTLQHLSFFGTALLFWWTTIAATTRQAQAIALLALLTTMIHGGVLGALLTMSPHAWYAGYAATSEALGVDALHDQQLGGLLMWVPAGLVYLGIGIALAFRWFDADAEPQAPADATQAGT